MCRGRSTLVTSRSRGYGAVTGSTRRTRMSFVWTLLRVDAHAVLRVVPAVVVYRNRQRDQQQGVDDARSDVGEA